MFFCCTGCHPLRHPLQFIKYSVITTISFLLFCSNSFADEIKVFKNRYVVEVKEAAFERFASTSSNSSEPDLTSVGAKVMRSLGQGSQRKTKLVSPAFKHSRLMSADTSLTEEVVTYDPNDSFCIDLIKSGAVESCTPDFEMRINATVPNDPSFSSLWGMTGEHGINAPSAWDLNTGSQDVVVAVIDTGVDYNHPDLSPNIWVNSGEIMGNNRDDDGNGYIDDVYGWNAYAGSGNPMDDNGHGTHVSGTIGAAGNNGLGVVGVNWKVKIMGLKFLSSTGSGSLSAAVEAINYMVTMKNRGVNIRVSNNSWGGGGYSQTLHAAIQRAEAAGILFVAAAGNESNDNDANPSYPATYNVANVISVAAIDREGNMATFSNYGAQNVDIAAPGVSILSTYPGGGYTSLSGTSMATPHVAGALALLLSNEPSLSNEAAIQRLYLTASPKSSLVGVVATERSLNVAGMLYNQTSPLPQPTPVPAPCAYSVQGLPFDPDTTVQASDIVIQADEYNYYPVELPFSFPFFNQQISRLYVSPNGIVYTKAAPSGMDYVNSSQAPLNSIAAMHADLTTTDSPHAVRVKVAADHITIYWLAESYSLKGQGDVEAWLTIFSDGRIDDYISFQNSRVEALFQDKSTVGITGSYSSNSKTYAFNSSAMRSGTAIRYTPQCSSDPGSGSVVVSKLSLKGKDGSGKTSKEIKPGKGFEIGIEGTGSGSVQINAAFNDKTCPFAAIVAFNNGSSLTGRMPNVNSAFSSIKVTAGPLGKKAKISHSKSKRTNRSKVRSKRISSKNLRTSCEKLFNSLQNG